jgi:hypothetical protein
MHFPSKKSVLNASQLHFHKSKTALGVEPLAVFRFAQTRDAFAGERGRLWKAPFDVSSRAARVADLEGG